MNATTTASHVGNMTSSTIKPNEAAAAADDGSVGAYTTVLAVTAHLVAMLFGGGKCLAVVTALLTKPNINKYSYLLVLTLLLACCCVNFIYSPVEISDLLTYHYHQRHPCSDYLAAKTSLYVFLVVLIGMVIVLVTLEAIIRPANCFGHVVQKIWPLTACLFVLVWSTILTAVFICKLMDSTSSPSSTTSLSSSSSSSSSSSLSNVVKYYNRPPYVMTDDSSLATFVTIITLVVSLVLLALLVLLVRYLKSYFHWENGHPHFRKKKMSLAMPEFLISQSQGEGDEECTGGYDNVNEPSTSRSPSPSTPKLLMVSSPDSASIKGGEGVPRSQTTTPKSLGNRLGINMAQVLGRRRHTICQISDSTKAAPAPPDPMNKAKQYNYVRKFSVDIAALQAQLQNPKVFKEAPFQSDIDLNRRGDADKDKAAPKPLQPLKPLNLKLDERKTNSSPVKKDTAPTVITEAKVETPQSAGLSIPPPVIMVSNDDAIPEKDDNNLNEDGKENVHSDKTTGDNNDTTVTEDNHKTNCNHYTKDDGNNANVPSSRPEIPTSLPLKENQIITTMGDNKAKNDVIVKSVIPPGLECSSPMAISFGSPHDTSNATDRQGESNTGDDVDYKLTRLSVSLCLTFLVTMVPVVIIHALHDSAHADTFVSVSTCTLAISTALQTIVYPHLIACCDGVVRKAVRRLKNRARRFCLIRVCRRDDVNDDGDDDEDYTGGGPHRSHNIDDTSSTSHV